MLEYVLEDFLELKASLTQPQMDPLKEFLFSRQRDGLALEEAEGFRLAEYLVLIEAEDPTRLEHLILLNPASGEICVKRISKGEASS